MALLSGKQNAKKRQLGCQTELTLCGRDGMVDIPDLKSVGRMPVWVRLPPPAPKTFLIQGVRKEKATWHTIQLEQAEAMMMN